MAAETKIRVALADDHAILRSGLRMLLSAEPDMEVVGEAADGVEAIELTKAKSPDVLVLDINMPRLNGIQALKSIVAQNGSTRVVILTVHDDPAYLRSLLAAGASGYVLKKSVDSELLSAIRAARRKGLFVDPSMAHELVMDRLGTSAPRKQLLSEREEQVLKFVAEGFTSPQIAEKMRISVKTVETYRSRVGRKLGLNDRSEFVRYAREFGYLKPAG